MILYVSNSTHAFISRPTLRPQVPSTRTTPNTVINNYIWGESAEVEVIITPETINNYRVGQLDAGWGWMGRTMWKGRVASLAAPRAIEMRGRVGRNSPRVWSLSRARSPRQETLFLADPSRLASCLSFVSSRSSSRGSFFFSSCIFPFPLLVLSEGLDPGDRIGIVLAFESSSTLSLPVRFLPLVFSPRMSFLTRYSPDRERKSSELNECRVPLERSLSMPTRETPVLAS